MLICENINKIYKKKEYQIIGIFTIAIVVLLYSYNYFERGGRLNVKSSYANWKIS